MRHILAGLVLSVSLAACQMPMASLMPTSFASTSSIPIKVESIEGAPEGVQLKLKDELASAAPSRKVEMVSSEGQARYKLKGYLTAAPQDDGSTTLAFVWDVFDGQKKRARRITGSMMAQGGTTLEPWTAADKEALRKLAAQSMEEIVTFLNQAETAPSLADKLASSDFKAEEAVLKP